MSRLLQTASIILEGLIGGMYVYSFTMTGHKFEVIMGIAWLLICALHVIPEILELKSHK